MNTQALVELCYDAYDIVTGFPLEDRDNEGHFPEAIMELMGRFEIDYDDFQETWNDYAG